MRVFEILVIIATLVPFVHSFVFPPRIRTKTQNMNCYNEEYPSDCENTTLDELQKTLYIVIWEKNDKAYKLIAEMEKQGLHTVFIPEDELDIMRLTTSDMPMVYKEDVLLESWMDIYAEMYPM